MDTFLSLVHDWISGVSKDILILKNSLLYLIIHCLVVSDCLRTSSSIPKAKISLILQHFLFWAFPTFTPPAHASFNKSYQVWNGLIRNYPSFKVIPNTTNIVLILEKYNRSKSSFLTFCAGYRFSCWLSLHNVKTIKTKKMREDLGSIFVSYFLTGKQDIKISECSDQCCVRVQIVKSESESESESEPPSPSPSPWVRV